MPNYDSINRAVLQAFLFKKMKKSRQKRISTKKEVDYCKKVCYDIKENRGLCMFSCVRAIL